MNDPLPAIQLSEQERQLFAFLLASVAHTAGPGAAVTLRVAGGWVRDKLMGRPSADIDVVVEGMRALALVEGINAFLSARAGGAGSAKNFSTVEADPEHGKHMTAYIISLFDLSVDILELRGSSALEDAQQRDLTVNACFYNITQARVEDATGMALPDLEQGVLRTPVHPSITFAYDPLRAVRAARFAATLGFTLHESLKLGLRESQVRTGLAQRTKRDRIGIECRKALSADAPAMFVRVVVDAGLFSVVFLDQNDDNPAYAAEALQRAQSLQELLGAGHAGRLENVSRAGLFFAAILWHLAPVMDESGKRPQSALIVAVVQHMRLSVQLGNEAASLCTTARTLLELCAAPLERLSLGRCLRAAGALWTGAWVLALAHGGPAVRAQLDVLWEGVSEMGLLGCWRWKHVLNGNDVSRLLRLNAGPLFSVIMEQQMDEMLKRPEGFGRIQAEQWLLQTFQPNK